MDTYDQLLDLITCHLRLFVVAQYVTADIQPMQLNLPDKANALDQLIRSTAPGVALFMSHPKPEWFNLVEREKAQLAVVEVYLCDDNTTAIRLNGSTPQAEGSFLTSVSKIQGAKLWRAHGAATNWPATQPVILFGASVLPAKCRKSNGDVFITVTRGNLPESELALWRLNESTYVLRPTSQE